MVLLDNEDLADVQGQTDIVVTLVLSNWLNSYNSTTFTFTREDVPVPVVSLSSPLVNEYIYRDIDLVVSASPPDASCLGNVSDEGSAFGFEWTQFSGPETGLTFATLASAAIPAYSLLPAQTYEFQVIVSYFGDSGTSTASAVVKVETKVGALVAKLSPGDTLISLESGIVVLNASLSYDPDVISADKDYTVFDYSWACETESGDDCMVGQSELGSQVAIFNYDSASLSVGVVYTYTVTMTDPVDSTRVASFSSLIRYTQDVVPVVLLDAEVIKVNIGDRAFLEAPATVDAAFVANNVLGTPVWTWSCPSLGGDFTTRDLIESDPTGQILVLRPNVLTAGFYYEFTATVDYNTDGMSEGWSKITIVGNADPQGGVCVTDVAEAAFGEVVQVTCSDWTDDTEDLPLDYQFGYLSPLDGTFTALTVSYQSSPKASLILPTGNLTLVTRIRDRHAAVATFNTEVTITEADLEAEGALEALTDVLSDSTATALANGDLSSMSQLVGASLSIQPVGSEQGTATRDNMIAMLSDIGSTVAPSASSASATLTMLGSVCSDPGSLSNSTRFSSLDLFTNSLNTGAQFGAVSDQDAAGMLTTVSTVMTSAKDNKNGTSAEERAAMANATQVAMDRLSTSMSAGMVSGQDAITLVSGDVELQAQVFDDVTKLNMNAGDNSTGGGFSMGDTGSVPQGVSVCASLTLDQNNMFEGEVQSGVLSLTFYDCSTNELIEYSGGAVTIELASGANGEPTECSYWDAELQDWSNEGCTVIDFDENSTLCECTHLTSFAATIAPPLSIPDPSILTWANIKAHPEVFLFVGVMTAVFILLAVWGNRLDHKKDVTSIILIAEKIQNHIHGTEGDTENEELEQFFERAKFRMFSAHTWGSVIGRHPCDNVSSIDHTWITYTGLLSAATISLIFTAQADDERSAELLMVLTAVYGGATSAVVAFIITKSFPQGTTRFDKLFLKVFEKLAEEKGYFRDREFRYAKDNLEQYIGEFLVNEYGLAGTQLALASAVALDEIRESVIVPPLYKSKITELREQGYALLKDVLPMTIESMLFQEWEENNWYYTVPPRKKFGYVFMFLVSGFCWTMITSYMMDLLVLIITCNSFCFHLVFYSQIFVLRLVFLFDFR